jgi:hypothetical protein
MTMLRLRLRAWLGWGRAPDDLRVQSAQLFKVGLVIAVMGSLFYPSFLLVGSIFYKPYGAYLRYLFTTRAGLLSNLRREDLCL